MSLALGPQAFEAAQRLKGTDDWKVIVTALTEQMGRLMHAAVEAATPEICGYARALRDVVWAFEVMEAGAGAPGRMAVKPAVPVREKARV